MFTKALITKIPDKGDNWFKVRIPLFEDTTGTEVTYDALCCYSPGTFGGLNVGDCVYVTFEDAKLNIPVIIGKLYTREDDDYAKGLFNNLKVTNTANLPLNTIFGNAASAGDLIELLQNQITTVVENAYPVGSYFFCSRGVISPNNIWPETTWVGTDIAISGINLTAWRRTN